MYSVVKTVVEPNSPRMETLRRQEYVDIIDKRDEILILSFMKDKNIIFATNHNYRRYENGTSTKIY